jgi:hypothetical protein
LPTNNQFSGENMGIRVLNAAVTNTIAAMRTMGVAQAVPIEYAAAKDARPGMTFFESPRQLLAYLDNAGWPKSQEIKVHWAPAPPAPAALMAEVRSAIATYRLGAQAYTSGNSTAFDTNRSDEILGHEAAHVVQQSGRPNNLDE